MFVSAWSCEGLTTQANGQAKSFSMLSVGDIANPSFCQALVLLREDEGCESAAGHLVNLSIRVFLIWCLDDKGL